MAVRPESRIEELKLCLCHFDLTLVSTVRTAQNSFVRFVTGQLHPTDAIVNNIGNIPRQINPKQL